jgi:methionyl-tRNA formyltransferase
MGTPQFSADILEELARVHEVVGVYTRPDAVRGRGKKLVASPVKEVADRLDLPVFTPKTLRTPEAQQELAALQPEIICVAAYGAILPKEVLEIAPHGCLNVHTSLLPRWRGAAPIERAILAGDEEVGVCIMAMEEGLDTGAYCVCRQIPVGNLTAAQLTDELAQLGASALLTALAQVEAGHLSWVSQNEEEVTYAHKIEKGELDLDPALSALQNERQVRASSEAHPARCTIAGKRVTVLAANQVDADSLTNVQYENLPAEAEAKVVQKRLFLGCAEGILEVREVKPDGKRAMDAWSFAAGLPELRGGKGTWSHD